MDGLDLSYIDLSGPPFLLSLLCLIEYIISIARNPDVERAIDKLRSLISVSKQCHIEYIVKETRINHGLTSPSSKKRRTDWNVIRDLGAWKYLGETPQGL